MSYPKRPAPPAKIAALLREATRMADPPRSRMPRDFVMKDDSTGGAAGVGNQASAGRVGRESRAV